MPQAGPTDFSWGFNLSEKDAVPESLTRETGDIVSIGKRPNPADVRNTTDLRDRAFLYSKL